MLALRNANAFVCIANSRSSDVVQSLSNTRFGDRIIRNLSDVLTFHALTVHHLNASAELQRQMYVLAKRGDRSLRNAISAIRRGEFLEANDSRQNSYYVRREYTPRHEKGTLILWTRNN